jgi:thymidylate synthase
MEHMIEESMHYDKLNCDESDNKIHHLSIRRVPLEQEQKLNQKTDSDENYNNEIPLGETGVISQRIFANIQKFQHEEYQYLNLLENILENGSWEEGRNGRTKSIFGDSMRFSLKDGKIPILTTKKTAWKTCLKELLWFIHGETDNRLLKEQGVHIWDANSTREFLDSRGLTLTREDLIGPGYGYQWRFFNANYNCFSGKRLLDHDPNDVHKNRNEFKGIDQLQKIIDALKDPKERTSRRLIMTAWNPCQLDQMALPPCHIFCQFNVHDGNKLSCAMYQRSNDFFLGIPFNIASYSLLTHLIAKHCGLEAYEFVHFMGNCHLYENAIDAAKLQITREPFEFPTVSIEKVRVNINDYQVEDFKIHNYKSHEQIKVAMVA